MPRAKFDEIYRDLKLRIESDEYPQGELLPSENELAATYECSRNTVRRAMAQLASEGYVQPMHGRGVRNIYSPTGGATFIIGGIESFKESAVRNQRNASTQVLRFEEMTVDAKFSEKSGFEIGALVLHIIRLREFDDEPLIIDHNWFRRELLPGLTPELAAGSVYDYIEEELGMTITTSKRTITVERATAFDEMHLDLKGYNCMAVVTSQTYDDNGVQFEFTQSRHRPDYFRFQDVATRRRQGA